MSRIYTSVSQLIGGTPLLELCNMEKADQLSARILVKLESRNPAGSAKDRVALSMIEDAENRGILKPGSVIIEPTSGNTGIGLCAVAAARGYHCIIVMPDSMSMERVALFRLLFVGVGQINISFPGLVAGELGDHHIPFFDHWGYPPSKKYSMADYNKYNPGFLHCQPVKMPKYGHFSRLFRIN